MKYLVFILLMILSVYGFSQNPKQQKNDDVWDQGVPILPSDPYIMSLINQLGDSLRKWDYVTTGSKASVCREIGLAFYDRGLYDAADFYLTRSRNFREELIVEKTEKKLNESEIGSIRQDENLLNIIPEKLENISRSDLKNLVKEIESKIKNLVRERDSLVLDKAPKALIDSKNKTINTLKKERDITNITLKNKDLNDENVYLLDENIVVKRWLLVTIVGILVLILGIIVLFQRKRIKFQNKELDEKLDEIQKKNTYLEHAAKLIRHDMHSGINTYIPRGITSLKKRLTNEDIQRLKIETSLKMISEGLTHTQKVYKGVSAFTDLVKTNAVLEKNIYNIKNLLEKYFQSTSYKDSVFLDDNLPELSVNEHLFCTVVENLVKNGLNYNDSSIKIVKIYLENDSICVEDNGRGMTEQQLKKNIKYIKKENGVESGIGLSICKAILDEHGFSISAEKLESNGTKIKINFLKK
jgi:signal transduction histidine kinase